MGGSVMSHARVLSFSLVLASQIDWPIILVQSLKTLQLDRCSVDRVISEDLTKI